MNTIMLATACISIGVGSFFFATGLKEKESTLMKWVQTIMGAILMVLGLILALSLEANAQSIDTTWTMAYEVEYDDTVMTTHETYHVCKDVTGESFTVRVAEMQAGFSLTLFVDERSLGTFYPTEGGVELALLRALKKGVRDYYYLPAKSPSEDLKSNYK